METRNLIYNEFGTVDMEINHPDHGWIPFTADPADSVQLGQDLYAEAIAGDHGPIAAYVGPTAEELLAATRSQMVVSRFQARAALHNAGLLAGVQTHMDTVETDEIVKLAWTDAAEFRRLAPTVAAIATAMSLTDLEVDNLFTAAALITA